MAYLLGIDQGTSGSRALIIDDTGQVRGYGYASLPRIYPQPGWAEQDPDVLAAGVASAITAAITEAGCSPSEIIACGITCQRNTNFVWDARTGRPLANAITWQDLRTIPMMAELAQWSHADERRHRLGYFPGPYCAALHLAWRMKHDGAVRNAADGGYLRIGTSANWLLTALGHENGHALDDSLVQSLGVYDFRARQYWTEWLELLNLPTPVPHPNPSPKERGAMAEESPSPLSPNGDTGRGARGEGNAFPQPVPTVHEFGTIRVTAANGESADVPVLATLGNEQAALFGHHCHRPGEAECSHGTASFIDVFVGEHVPENPEKLNAYFAWRLKDNRYNYCLEADTTVSGAAIRWMKEEARLFDHESELSTLAASVPDSAGVIFVPAFTGLNVPHNDPTARGTIFGLTLGSNRAHIIRAFLESLGYQMRAILETIEAETQLQVERLSVGGGIAVSDIACQIQADLIGIPIVRPAFTETAARAAALLAGMGANIWSSPTDLPPLPGAYTIFDPTLSAEARDDGYAHWHKAISRTKNY